MNSPSLTLAAKRSLRRQLDRADAWLATLSPRWRRSKKYRDELAFWEWNRQWVLDWFNGQRDWWGIQSPTATQKIKTGGPLLADAVATLHRVCPIYPLRLKVPAGAFTGQRILEIGSGPLVPITQFTDCECHAVDPLMDGYRAQGWPLDSYSAECVAAPAESLPFPDAHFDATMSVNALDHVDDFEQAAREIIRVTKPGGRILLELEYHEPRDCEPQSLDDRRVLKAFAGCEMKKAADQTKRDAFKICGFREDVFSTEDRVIVWHGVRPEKPLASD
jgi:SAM-dependent methyltransferase